MSEKQLLHEINSSREATEEIRKQVLQAKQKGYFNSTKFGRHFISTFVPDFAKELLQTTSKTDWGRATTTNIVVRLSINAGSKKTIEKLLKERGWREDDHTSI